MGRGEEDVRNHATGRKGRADMLYPFGKHHKLQGFVSAKAHHDKIILVLCHFICDPSQVRVGESYDCRSPSVHATEQLVRS